MGYDTRIDYKVEEAVCNTFRTIFPKSSPTVVVVDRQGVSRHIKYLNYNKRGVKTNGNCTSKSTYSILWKIKTKNIVLIHCRFIKHEHFKTRLEITVSLFENIFRQKLYDSSYACDAIFMSIC